MVNTFSRILPDVTVTSVETVYRKMLMREKKIGKHSIELGVFCVAVK